MRGIAVRVVVSLLVAAGLIVVLLRWGDVGLGDVRATLARLSFATWGAALGLHVALYALRAWRFQVLLPPGGRTHYSGQLAVTLAHGMASIVLPAKVGEVTYVVYAERVLGIRHETALAVLLVSRLLDFAAIGVMMGTACVALAIAGTGPGWLGGAGVAALVGGVGLWALGLRGRWIAALGVWGSRGLGAGRWELGRRWIGKLESAGRALDDAGEASRVLRAGVVSVAAWGCVFGFCAVLGRGMGLPEEVGWGEAVLGSGVAVLTSLVPVSAFASIGTLEAGWVVGFGLVGVGRELALATGAGLHVVQLVNVVGLGVVGHVAMGVMKGRRGAA